jgi:hypothetical protein
MSYMNYNPTAPAVSKHQEGGALVLTTKLSVMAA